MLDGFDDDDTFQNLMQRMHLNREDMEIVFRALDDDASGRGNFWQSGTPPHETTFVSSRHHVRQMNRSSKLLTSFFIIRHHSSSFVISSGKARLASTKAMTTPGEVDYLEFCYHLGTDLSRDPLNALSRYCVMEVNTELKMLKARLKEPVEDVEGV